MIFLITLALIGCGTSNNGEIKVEDPYLWLEEVEGKTGRDQLADSIKDAINKRLEELEGFGGVEGVYFTAFVLQ